MAGVIYNYLCISCGKAIASVWEGPGYRCQGCRDDTLKEKKVKK